jgi:hypothetical protein
MPGDSLDGQVLLLRQLAHAPVSPECCGSRFGAVTRERAAPIAATMIPANGSREALQETTARAAVEHLLNRLVALLSDPHHPACCLLVKGGLSSAKADDSIRDEMIKRRLAGENALRERFERAKAEGDLPAKSDPAGLAFYVTTITQGMTVQAVNGTDENELRRLVEMVLQTWPNLVESSAGSRR